MPIRSPAVFFFNFEREYVKKGSDPIADRSSMKPAVSQYAKGEWREKVSVVQVDQTSAIVMAGYNNKWAVRKYAKIVAEHYGETFIETGYKPLREFEIVENGQTVNKPLIQFTLEQLIQCERINDITIVGHQMLLEQRLKEFLNQSGKPYQIINQNSGIPADVIKTFHIRPRKVKHNSIAGNMIKGYAASAAFESRRHALFVASDSPLTTSGFIDRFLDLAAGFADEYTIILPSVLVEGPTDLFGRYPLKLINDSEFRFSDKTDAHGRQGFRLSSLMYANPHGFDINTANTAYNLRKCLNPKVQLKLFRITRNLGYKNVYTKHFIQKDLSLREVENITSAFFDGRLKIIPVQETASSFDYDGTDDEYRRLGEILRNGK